MIILGLDFETTGLDTANDRIIEVGWALWDSATNRFYGTGSQYVRQTTNSEVEKANGISQLTLDTYGVPINEAFASLKKVWDLADAICAYNGLHFDKLIFEAECARHSISLPPRLWIDPLHHIDFPDSIRTRNLTYLCAEHGFLNPFPHVAIFDVVSMLRVLSNYPVEKVLANATSLIILAEATTSYDQRQLAKDAGFYWDGDAKVWLRRIRENQLDELQRRCPCRIRSSPPAKVTTNLPKRSPLAQI